MERTPSLLSRVAERALGWVVLAALVAAGVAWWQTPAATKAAIWNGAWNTAVWLILCAALPWSATLYIGRVLEAGSNAANAGLLAAFILLDALLGVWLMGGLPAGGWGWLLSAGLIALAAVYNYLVLEYLAQTRGP